MANVFETDMELEMRDLPQSGRRLCDQLQLFAKMKYLASRPLWNLQTLKAPDTKS